jgi:alanine racemase
MTYKLNRAWAEINLDNIAHNVKEIRKIVNKRAEIMGVVKADAYGHGALEVAKTLIDSGISRLAVSMIDEAIQLRQNGVHVPILVLGYTDPVSSEDIIKYNVTQTVFSYDLALALSSAAVSWGRKIKIHIKIDTGMTRIGFMPGYDAIKNVININELPGITIEGLFTHCASADKKDKSYSYIQFERFLSICDELKGIGINIPIKHIANSAAVIEYPEMHLDMVRLGIIIYGHFPSPEINKNTLSLKPAMALKANVILVKEVEKNTPVSYGGMLVTKRKSKIATIPIGYADGYPRLLTGKANVLVNGQLAPIAGVICMDQCMMDITDIEGNVKVGDEVVLFGRQMGREIKVEELASLIGAINYEIISAVGRRIPRIYLHNGEISNVLNYLV